MRSWIAVLSLVVSLGCGDDASPPDSGHDAPVFPDVRADDVAFADVARDVRSDGGADAGADASTDVGHNDSGSDAGPREPSAQVLAWKELFDAEWERALPRYTEESEGNGEGRRAFRYYDNNVVDSLIAIFQATGDTTYVDNLFWYLDRVKSIAIESDDGFFDWPRLGRTWQLNDGHGLRNVFKFLWLLKKHPGLRATANYQEKYDEYLSWFTRNIWDKWVDRGCGHLLRSRTHMASHMSSNMALYLSLLEDDPAQKAEYLSWVSAWNHDLHAKCAQYGEPGDGFRSQLRIEPSHGGYIWNSEWGRTTGSNDLGHANAEVQSVVNQYTHGIEWTQDDMARLVTTFNAMMDASPSVDFEEMPEFMDARYDAEDDNRPQVDYGWSTLGRFDQALQDRIAGFGMRYMRSATVYNNFLANLAYNQALLDENVIYPE